MKSNTLRSAGILILAKTAALTRDRSKRGGVSGFLRGLLRSNRLQGAAEGVSGLHGSAKERELKSLCKQFGT